MEKDAVNTIYRELVRRVSIIPSSYGFFETIDVTKEAPVYVPPLNEFQTSTQRRISVQCVINNQQIGKIKTSNYHRFKNKVASLLERFSPEILIADIADNAMLKNLLSHSVFPFSIVATEKTLQDATPDYWQIKPLLLIPELYNSDMRAWEHRHTRYIFEKYS